MMRVTQFAQIAIVMTYNIDNINVTYQTLR